MLFLFRFSICAEAFSNGRPTNIHISQKAITMKALYALSKLYTKPNISLEFNYLFTKFSMLKKEMICMAGYVLIRRDSLNDSALHDLVFLLVY